MGNERRKVLVVVIVRSAVHVWTTPKLPAHVLIKYCIIDLCYVWIGWIHCLSIIVIEVLGSGPWLFIY